VTSTIDATPESEAQLRAIFEHSLDAFLIVDDCGVCVRANPAARELLAAHDDSLAAVMPQLIMLISAGGRGEMELKTADGRVRQLEYVVRRDLMLSRHLVVLHDVSDRVVRERQFHMAQRMETIGQLAGGIAHDFNNILTAIVGFGTLLSEQVSADDAAAAGVSEILSAADRATSLTRQLLAFGRRQVLRPSRLQLGDVVRALSGTLRATLGEDIDLQISCAEGLPPVRVDQGQLEQVIANLVVNARDAMPTGGRLLIEVDHVSLDEAYCDTHLSVKPGEHVRIAISDNGVGISAERLSRVFEPFFTTKDHGKGSGLGLATAYGIVKQSGGNIWVYSEPGLGTTFRIYLPVDSDAALPARPNRTLPKERARGSETILLVEDAAVIRQLAREVLMRAGYQVLDAGDTESALEVAAAHDGIIDLLLTDVVMPGPNGVELADRLRVVRPQTRVLFMSGYTDNAAVRNGLLAPDTAFLQKPFTPEGLLRKIRHVIEAH
jgi:two-component system, cell cycle sensor histidine kinase and response regulator CckA